MHLAVKSSLSGWPTFGVLLCNLTAVVVLALGILCSRAFHRVCRYIVSHQEGSHQEPFVECIFSPSKVDFAEMVDKEKTNFKSICQS